MSDFFSVTHEFEALTGRFEFKQPKKLWYPHLVAFSKQLEDIFYCYVIARVYRQDGSLQCTLWVGPVDRPDDGLDNLSANIKVDIGYTQVLDENFFRNCSQKITNLIEAGTLTSLLAASKKELEHPSVDNYRYQVYTAYFLPFFRKILAATGNDKRVLGNKKKMSAVIEKEAAALTGEIKAFFDKLGINATRDKVWELCYIYSL